MSNFEDASLASTQARRPPFYRDATIVKWITQVAALLIVLFALVFLATNAGDNLRANSIPTGYDFLGVDPGIKLSGGIDDDPATGGRALWVGMVNTIRLSAGGIALATVLGVLVGVGRLSKNWLVRRLCGMYVETMRNVPLLVQILVIGAIISTLPRVSQDQGPIHGWLHISNKGMSVPRVHLDDGFYQWMVFIAIGAAAGWHVRRLRQRQQDTTGRETYPLLCMAATIAAAGIAGWWLHPAFGWLGAVFDGVADAIGGVPQGVAQAAVSVAALAAAGLWIKRFIDRRRTPAGLAKLTDDDYFRMVFAGVGALGVAAFIILVWPGLGSWLVNSTSDLFALLGDKFGDGRSGWPINAKRPDIEQLGNFPNYGHAGLNFPLAMAAVYFGVVLYTAAFIAEIVRGGILAVPKGQTEAAQAVGLRRSTMLRRVILPQAFRVVMPPLGNQYLNLTKNTSLAIAVGYTDLVQVGQTVYNQTGKVLEVVSIWMLFYLACSLTISAAVNFFNVRLKIVER